MSASYACAVHSGWVSLLLFQRKIVQAVDLERFAPQPDPEYTRFLHHFPKDGQLLGAKGRQTSEYVKEKDHSSMLFKEIGAVVDALCQLRGLAWHGASSSGNWIIFSEKI